MKPQKFIDESIKTIARRGGIVVDIGGGEKFQKWLEPYRDLFRGVDYKSFDYDASTHPDIVGDIHHIPLADGTIDSIICASVLEHIENPIVACKELHRVLKPGGFLFLYVPSIYPYHARKGHYPDYWRFFDDTLLFLLKDFSDVKLEKRGGYFFALSFFIPKQHRFRFIIDPVARFLDLVLRSNTTTAGYYVLAKKG